MDDSGPQIEFGNSKAPTASPPAQALRAMQRAELMGGHTHRTRNGAEVHVWQRDGKYLIRGSYGGHRFGKTVGRDRLEAEAGLREVLTQIENGTFLNPSVARKQLVKTGQPPQLSVRELVAAKLAESRSLRGKNTAGDYHVRLEWLIRFAESKTNRAHYKLASSVDRNLALGFAAYLRTLTIAGNGHCLSEKRPMAGRQIHNILSATAMLFDWGRRSDVNLLPSFFTNPFTREIVGTRPMKDLLEKPLLTMDVRIPLVGGMDAWQLCIFGLSLVLPQRPEEFAGLLISDVDLVKRELLFATRLSGDDFNKAHASFRCLYPPQLDPLIAHLIGGRTAGPLLLRRTAVDGRRPARFACTHPDQITTQFHTALLKTRTGEVTCTNDRKGIFRGVLRSMGGVDEDAVAREFRALLAHVRPEVKARYYALRGAVLSDMAEAGVDELTRLYVTGRSLRRQTNAHYEYQNLVTQMGRYFRMITPLLEAISNRAAALGIAAGESSP